MSVPDQPPPASSAGSASLLPAVARDRRELARGEPGGAVEPGQIAESGAAPVDLGHEPGQVAEQEIARHVQAGRGIAEALRGREPDQLGHHVVAVDQHVLHQVAQRHALMHRHDRCAGGRDAAQRRAKRDALRAGKLAEQIAGVQAGVLDRQLGQLAAPSAVGDAPHHGLLVAALERDPARRQRPGGAASKRASFSGGNAAASMRPPPHHAR